MRHRISSIWGSNLSLASKRGRNGLSGAVLLTWDQPLLRSIDGASKHYKDISMGLYAFPSRTVSTLRFIHYKFSMVHISSSLVLHFHKEEACEISSIYNWISPFVSFVRPSTTAVHPRLSNLTSPGCNAKFLSWICSLLKNWENTERCDLSCHIKYDPPNI